MAHDKPLYQGIDHETAEQLSSMELQVFQGLWLVQKAYSDQLTRNSTGFPELDDFIQALIPFHASNEAPQGNNFAASNYSNPIYNTDQNTIQNYDLILGFNEADRYADLLLETHPNMDFIGVRLLPFQSTFYLENVQGTPQVRLLLGFWSHSNMVQSYRALIDEHGSELPPEMVQALNEFVDAFAAFDDLVNQHNEALAIFNESLNTALQMVTGLLGDFDPIGFLLENAPTPPEDVPGEEDLPERPQITPTPPTAGEIFKAMQPVFSIVRAIKREKDETIGGFYSFLNEVLKQILESFSLDQLASYQEQTAQTLVNGSGDISNNASKAAADLVGQLESLDLGKKITEITGQLPGETLDGLSNFSRETLEGLAGLIKTEITFFEQLKNACTEKINQASQLVDQHSPNPIELFGVSQGFLNSIKNEIEAMEVEKIILDKIEAGNQLLGSIDKTLIAIKDGLPGLPADGVPSDPGNPGNGLPADGVPSTGPLTFGAVFSKAMIFLEDTAMVKSRLTTLVGAVILISTSIGVLLEPEATWNENWAELGIGVSFLFMNDPAFAKRFFKIRVQ